MRKKHKIVMLPTEDISGLVKVNGTLRVEKGMFNYPKKLYPDAQQQHLHILSDDEIKEGDWCICLNETGTELITRQAVDFMPTESKKIIATTGPKFMVPKEYDEYGGNVKLPQIPQSLIEYYAKHQPEEVELEYEMNGDYNGGCTSIWKEIKLQDNEVVWVETEETIEVELDGNDITVSIYRKDCNEHYNVSAEELIEMHDKLEEKLYTREEVEKLRDLASAIIGPACDILPDTYKEEIDEYYKWLKENL